MKKRFLSVVLTLSMVASSLVPVFASESELVENACSESLEEADYVDFEEIVEADGSDEFIEEEPQYFADSVEGEMGDFGQLNMDVLDESSESIEMNYPKVTLYSDAKYKKKIPYKKNVVFYRQKSKIYVKWTQVYAKEAYNMYICDENLIPLGVARDECNNPKKGTTKFSVSWDFSKLKAGKYYCLLEKRYNAANTWYTVPEYHWFSITLKDFAISGKSAVKVGKSIKLSVPGADKKKIKWSTSNKKIATVENGKVKGKKAGKVKITAKYNGKKLKKYITVSK